MHRRCQRWLVLGSLLVVSASAVAGSKVPTIVAPQLGPVARPPKPLILVLQGENQRSYGDPARYGLMVSLMNAVSNSNFSKATARTAELIKTTYPTFDLEAEIRASFHCAEPASLCSELVPFAPVSDAAEHGLRDFMRSHQWTEARMLTLWWENVDGRMAARATVVEFYDTGKEKLWSTQPILVGYYITPPKAGKNPEPDPVHSDEWEVGAPLPREAAMRAAIAGVEPLVQMALSWAANNDPKVFTRDVTIPIRKVRDQGIDCSSMRQCVAAIDSVVGDRAWWWMVEHESVDFSKYGRFVLELQSRSRVAP